MWWYLLASWTLIQTWHLLLMSLPSCDKNVHWCHIITPGHMWACFSHLSLIDVEPPGLLNWNHLRFLHDTTWVKVAQMNPKHLLALPAASCMCREWVWNLLIIQVFTFGAYAVSCISRDSTEDKKTVPSFLDFSSSQRTKTLLSLFLTQSGPDGATYLGVYKDPSTRPIYSYYSLCLALFFPGIELFI